MSFIKDMINKIKNPEDDFEEEIVGTEGAGDAAEENNSGVTYFYYSYNGSIGGNSFSYEVSKRDEGIIFVFEGLEFRHLGEMRTELDEAFLGKLDSLYRECNLRKWDGYSKTNRMVLDGDGFSLRIKFGNGKSISASGSNCTPKGYREFREKMNALFEPLKEKLLDEAKQKKIKEGLKGKIGFAMVNFIQHGKSGSDRYELMLYTPEIRPKNLELRVKSVSGKYFPKGDITLYQPISDVQPYYDMIEEAFRKYDIIKWYDYDKTAEDYNNCEWFQLNFGFENGYFNACGTEHPENYDEFREALIKIMQMLFEG